MIGIKIDKIINDQFESLLTNYQEGWENKMKGSDC